MDVSSWWQTEQVCFWGFFFSWGEGLTRFLLPVNSRLKSNPRCSTSEGKIRNQQFPVRRLYVLKGPVFTMPFFKIISHKTILPCKSRKDLTDDDQWKPSVAFENIWLVLRDPQVRSNLGYDWSLNICTRAWGGAWAEGKHSQHTSRDQRTFVITIFATFTWHRRKMDGSAFL